jgi:hypothetical protein
MGQLAKQGSCLLREQFSTSHDAVRQHSENGTTENGLPEQHIFPSRDSVATVVGVGHAITSANCAGAAGHAESSGFESESVEKTAAD